MVAYIIILVLLVIYPAWRIFRKAGLNPAWSLLIIPGLGIVALIILAYANWPTTKKIGGV